MKESHAFVIFMAGLLPIGAFLIHLTIIDFGELYYIKGKLVDINYEKQFITVEDTMGSSITLNLSCKGSGLAIEALQKGIELDVWYDVVWGAFKPEIWEMKQEHILLCSYHATHEQWSMIRNISILLSLIAWYFAFAQYRRRKNEITITGQVA